MDTTMDSQNALAPVDKLLGVGADVFAQLEKTISRNRVTGLRIKLGDRVIKEIPITTLSTVAAILVAIGAVLLSSLSVEVEHEPRTA